jgi:2-isopropylmalate synthase
VGNPQKGDPNAKVPVIAGLARANKADIDKAWEGQRRGPSTHPYLLATSPIHMKFKLKWTRSEVIERVREMVAYAKAVRRCGVQSEDAGAIRA